MYQAVEVRSIVRYLGCHVLETLGPQTAALSPQEYS
jgi:hypothetical protein